MAVEHARPGELIEVRPLGDGLAAAKTQTLVKSSSIEVIRLILQAGKKIAEHRAPGDMTLHCLEGRVRLSAVGKFIDMTPGSMVHLLSEHPHAVQAEENSSLLLTIVLAPKSAPVQQE
ncbi:MAG TPA: cupin domain-containing protein [Lacipirellulaceae bacterium]|nr:cupin domain-containing protein [Lacipirellulaceae bacterium]HMP04788.1 cupin domain-containing protein [Lacipirellulaceae bacterium]